MKSEKNKLIERLVAKVTHPFQHNKMRRQNEARNALTQALEESHNRGMSGIGGIGDPGTTKAIVQVGRFYAIADHQHNGKHRLELHQILGKVNR